MAEDAVKPDPPAAQAPPSPDPFASAKATLRDTLKWLTTTFAGVVGVVIAGTSLSGITKLEQHDQLIALVACGIGLLCIVAATGVMLQLLLPQTFYFGELLDAKNKTLLERLDRHAVEFLPPEYATIREFINERDSAVQKMREHRKAPDSKKYKEGAAFLDDNIDAIEYLAYLAHYELSRGNLRRRQWLLFGLASIAIVSLILFAVKVGAKKDPPPTKPAPIEAHVSLDASPALIALRQSAMHNESLTLLLEAAVQAGVIPDASTSSSHSPLVNVTGCCCGSRVTQLPKKNKEPLVVTAPPDCENSQKRLP